MKYINVHTHHPDLRADVQAVRNYSPLQFMSDCPEPSAFVSVGIHPWRVDEKAQAELAAMASLLQNKQIVAVGEIGLDKCCDTDFARQQAFFVAQLKMAACVGLPVIVHCVKAWDELLAAVRQVDNCPPIIIHGFRGKPEQAKQLMKWGFFLSFGPLFNEDTLKQTPLNYMFLETDDIADADIVSLYEKVAKIKGVTVDELKAVIVSNFRLIGGSQ